MNAYAVLIASAVLAEFVLHLLADRLNLRALAPELPDEFDGVYEADRYQKSQEYTRARTHYKLIPGLFDLVSFLGFWGLGGFHWLDESVRALEWGPTRTGLAFIGSLMLVRMITSLPFKYYSTFVIEERFGFNKTTRRTFWVDTLKGLVLGALLGLPLLAAILWCFGALGSSAWLWCWLLVTCFTLMIQFIAPTWIMPLFNEFTPLEEGALREAVLAYATRVSFPLEGLFSIDGSKRSTKANAFFTGFGKQKRIALFDTLIEKQGTQELVAIVAHEIGHYKRGHILKRMATGILQAGVVFFLLSQFLTNQALFDAFGVANPSVYAGLVFFSLLFSPIDMVISFFMGAVSRKHEFEADAFARETTGDGETLVRALKGLASDSLENLTPHPFYVKLHYSHPPVLERIQALRG